MSDSSTARTSKSGPVLTVISRSFPPQVSGSAILLANLLADYPGAATAIAGFTRHSKSDPDFKVPCPTHYLLPPRIRSLVFDYLGRQKPDLAATIMAAAMKRALRRQKSAVVLGAFPHHAFFVASFRAAQALELPFYAHMHDLWQENVPTGTPQEAFARKWESIILRQSTRVLCMTEAMQEHYAKKYGISSQLLPHTIRDEDLAKAPSGLLPAQLPQPTALFVGGLSRHMNQDALGVLAQASELLPTEYQLVFCTPDKDRLTSLGIVSSRLQAKFLSRAHVQELQSHSHVLMAPLSHKNGSADEVRTVFSTKLLEYLVAGRPILVFAPADSHHARSARDNGWGYVVSEDSPEALAAGIKTVVEDTALASRLVDGALKEARSRLARSHAEVLQDWVAADARAAR